MTKSRKRRTGSGYKAIVTWGARPGTGKPDSHSERHRVNPPHSGEEGMSYLERSLIWSVHTRTTAGVIQWDGVGEVSRGHSSGDDVGLREGLNLRMQGAD